MCCLFFYLQNKSRYGRIEKDTVIEIECARIYKNLLKGLIEHDSTQEAE